MTKKLRNKNTFNKKDAGLKRRKRSILTEDAEEI